MKNPFFTSVSFGFLLYFSQAWSADSSQQQSYQSHLVPAQHNNQFKEVLAKDAAKYQKALNDLQLVVLVDRSYSMLSSDAYAFLNYNQAPPSKFVNPKAPTDVSWKRMDSAFMIASHLATTMIKYDKDGKVPVYFFGSKVDKAEIHNAEELYMEFGKYPPDAHQTTNLKDALEKAFDQNIKRKHGIGKPNRTLFLVITDGKPDGKREKIADLIHHKVSSIDHHGERLNVFFIQIGDDEGASEFLSYMDNECKHIKKNVDTKKDEYIYARLADQVVLEAIFEDQE